MEISAMEQNRGKSVEWCRQEAPEHVDLVPIWWDRLGLSDYPSGLDYFMLDCVLIYGSDVSLDWLCLSIGHGPVRNCSIPMGRVLEWLGDRLDIEVVIDRMELYRKRRMRLDRNWSEERQLRVNRLIRVKKRAKKLVEKVKENEDEDPTSTGYGAVELGGLG